MYINHNIAQNCVMPTLEAILSRERAKLPKAGTQARAAFDKMKEAEQPLSTSLGQKVKEFLMHFGVASRLLAVKDPSGHTEISIKDSNPKQVVGFAINGHVFIDPSALGINEDTLSYSFRMQMFFIRQGKPLVHITENSIQLEIYKEGRSEPLATIYGQF